MTQKRFKKLLRAARIPEDCIRIFVNVVQSTGGRISYEHALKRPNKTKPPIVDCEKFMKQHKSESED